MNVKTKFNAGDPAWYMQHNELKQKPVYKIRVTETNNVRDGVNIPYIQYYMEHYESAPSS